MTQALCGREHQPERRHAIEDTHSNHHEGSSSTVITKRIAEQACTTLRSLASQSHIDMVNQSRSDTLLTSVFHLLCKSTATPRRNRTWLSSAQNIQHDTHFSILQHILAPATHHTLCFTCYTQTCKLHLLPPAPVADATGRRWPPARNETACFRPHKLVYQTRP